jgi:hypothetical protein
MASQNPNQRSKTPSPLASPRTKPLETKSRILGEVSRRGLSVHLGVHGRMINSTPNVAHTVTNSRDRIRKSHISGFLVLLRAVRCPGLLAESPGIKGASRDAAAGGIVGSALNLYSRHMAGKCRSVQTHSVILRPEGLDALSHIAIVNVAAIDFEEIA